MKPLYIRQQQTVADPLQSERLLKALTIILEHHKPCHDRLCWLSHLNKALPGVTADAAPTAQSVPASAGARRKIPP
jgi:hypothetical protein